jgi:5-(carboxyamino)imidazole ribonucleotide synthase
MYHIQTPYLDADGLALLVDEADAVTTEFENVPADALRQLATRRPVAPGGDAVAVCQDRAAEKAHFRASGVPCAPFAVIDSEADLAGVLDDLLPGILKTARLGYDGKGQVRVTDRAALEAAWSELGRVSCVLEKRLALAAEVSVIVARGADGQVVQLPLQQNLHRDGILAVTTVPAACASPEQAAEAAACAQRIAASLDYVGVLCVEFFLLADGSADRRRPGGQRDGAASAQLRPLQHRRLRRLAVRAAGALHGRPAAGDPAPAFALCDAQPAGRPVV